MRQGVVCEMSEDWQASLEKLKAIIHQGRS